MYTIAKLSITVLSVALLAGCIAAETALLESNDDLVETLPAGTYSSQNCEESGKADCRQSDTLRIEHNKAGETLVSTVPPDSEPMKLLSKRVSEQRQLIEIRQESEGKTVSFFAYLDSKGKNLVLLVPLCHSLSKQRIEELRLLGADIGDLTRSSFAPPLCKFTKNTSKEKLTSTLIDLGRRGDFKSDSLLVLTRQDPQKN